MNSTIFKKVEDGLRAIGRKTGFTYNEIKIIVYYFAIPFSWLCCLDIIFDFHYLKIAFVIFTMGFIFGCRNFKTYSDWLFNKSASFLEYFDKHGSNYIASSVWICVSLPIVIYGVHIYLIVK